MKCVAYTRGTAGVRGSAESIGFWRRVRLPLVQLRHQGLFSSFEVHDLGMEDQLTEGMLIGPDVVVLHNFFPREPEISLMEKLSIRLRASGQIPFWVYDLDLPSLLQEEEVFAILPLMRLITVPNTYLQEEIETLSRISFQHIEITPSTYDLAVFHEARTQVLPQKQAEDLFTLGCLGSHAWDRLLPGLFAALHDQLNPDQFSALRIVTDSMDVGQLALMHGVGGSLLVHSGLQVSTYPQLLAHCDVGLLPREGEDGEDICWLWEYGAMRIPCLAASGSAYEQSKLEAYSATFLPLEPEKWARCLANWIATKEGKESYKRLSEFAYTASLSYRDTLAGPAYAHIYRQILPISPRG